MFGICIGISLENALLAIWHAIDRLVASHLFVCDRIKNADPSGIGKIGCGGS